MRLLVGTMIMLFLTTGFSTPAWAPLLQNFGDVVLEVPMRPSNEVPPPTNAEASGSGIATLTLTATGDASGNITGGRVSLVARVINFPATTQFTDIQLFAGQAGENGPAVVDFRIPPASFTGGAVTFQAIAIAPLDVVIGLLTNPGAYYLNLPTVANPTGAIRGQVGGITISPTPGNQNGAGAVVDPTNANAIYLVANDFPPGSGLPGNVAYWVSLDAGASWTRKSPTGTNCGPAFFAVFCFNPHIAADRYGNIYVSYTRLNLSAVPPGSTIELAVSNNLFDTVSVLAAAITDLNLLPDGSRVATSPGPNPGQECAVVTAFDTNDQGVFFRSYVATGAGAANVSRVGPAQVLPNSNGAGVPDLIISRSPQASLVVAVALLFGTAQPEGDHISIWLTPNPCGGGSPGPRKDIAQTNVKVTQPIGPEPQGSRSGPKGAADATGKLFVVSAEAAALGGPPTKIVVRSSTDSGTTWSAPIQVNDNVGPSTTFSPSIVVDKASAAFVAWYDTRNVPTGNGAEVWGATSIDGVSFPRNFRLSLGASTATTIPNFNGLGGTSTTGAPGGFGAFVTWGDNSGGPPGNPNLDVAAAFILTSNDTPPVFLPYPQSVTLNATGPAGVIVDASLIPQATDPDGDPVSVSCIFYSNQAPVAPGTRLPIGLTIINCTAQDSHGKTATIGFRVTVLGADQQTANLSTVIQTFNFGLGNSLVTKAANALAAVNAGNTSLACASLDALGHEINAQASQKIPESTATGFMIDVNRIGIVLSCP